MRLVCAPLKRCIRARVCSKCGLSRPFAGGAAERPWERRRPRRRSDLAAPRREERGAKHPQTEPDPARPDSGAPPGATPGRGEGKGGKGGDPRAGRAAPEAPGQARAANSRPAGPLPGRGQGGTMPGTKRTGGKRRPATGEPRRAPQGRVRRKAQASGALAANSRQAGAGQGQASIPLSARRPRRALKPPKGGHRPLMRRRMPCKHRSKDAPT